jgi:hypothetical protein
VNIISKKLKKEVKKGEGFMNKNFNMPGSERDFSDEIEDEQDSLYCDPLEEEYETGEKPFSLKNKENKRNNEKNKDNDAFFG